MVRVFGVACLGELQDKAFRDLIPGTRAVAHAVPSPLGILLTTPFSLRDVVVGSAV